MTGFQRLREDIRLFLVRPKLLAPPHTEKSFEVCVIDDNPNVNTYHERWGITNERRHELIALLEEHNKTAKHGAEAIERVSKDCKHVNEVAMLCLLVGENSAGRRSPLSAFLAAISGRG